MKLSLIGKFQKMWDEEGKARSFEKLGHEVIRQDEGELTDLDQIFSLKPDAIIMAKLNIVPALRAKLIKEARALKIKTITWVPDLYWGLPRQFLIGNDPIFDADLVLTPDGGNDEKWKQKGVNHHLLRQAIFDEDCFIGEKVEYPPIVFVGTNNPMWHYRDDLDWFLRRKYGKRYGRYGISNSDHKRGNELNNLYISAKVVIGDSVASPYYWSNRIYETIGRGGFIIHPMTEGLDKEFTPYKHFVPYTFSDFDGLKEKIDHYLKHDKEREEIAMAGMEHCKKNHTLLNRCEQLITMI